MILNCYYFNVMRQLFSILFLVFLIFSCDSDEEYDYDIIITETPANMEELNSEYDDYNSNLSFLHERFQIYFSSNRNSKGGDFDIVGHPLDFSYHEEDDVLNISIPNDNSKEETVILPVINTDKNEFGPYSFYSGDDMIFMYASNSSIHGEYDIKYIEYTNWNYSGREQVVSVPKSIPALEKYKDDLYPSLTNDGEAMYFCSNYNDTVFNIYKADYGIEIDAAQFENNSDVAVTKDSLLSSGYDDKCPFINENLMVFTSNREGGFGGYDLWYSYLVNDAWSEPINFGSTINTEYDEFRPITFHVIDYELIDLMIFSSNRPNGCGGFDLYIVNISNMIQ